MSETWSSFPHDLSASTAAGLTHGVALPYQRLDSFAQVEMRHREQEHLAAAVSRRARQISREEKGQAEHGGLVTRWTTWLSSVLLRRSSRESNNSSVCAN
ncbi:hypothetical protein KIH74_10155 [Kineosporia sp. J2-2]|uniref:Uncharacterized protein n=1 Tax=Kineosporia corallincola TaxID=2835133 RepID=A0ABS5TI69_9ACTN|nr:hypothetical protein [Kineosporia corallincola]MBT0769284.1 hypothetical protein [Kineosporia corallincola]